MRSQNPSYSSFQKITTSQYLHPSSVPFFVLNACNTFLLGRVIFCLFQLQHPRPSFSVFLQSTLVSLSAFISTHIRIGKNSTQCTQCRLIKADTEADLLAHRLRGTEACAHEFADRDTRSDPVSQSLCVLLLSFSSSGVFVFVVKSKTVLSQWLYEKLT